MKLRDFNLRNFWAKRNNRFFVLMTIALLGVFSWGYSQYYNKVQLNTFVENGYQRIFYDMIQNVENVGVYLSKGLVSNAPRQAILMYASAWKESHSAQEKLNQLPVAHQLIERTSKFLNQVGDFSFTIVNQYAEGQGVSRNQQDQLQTLQKEADYLAKELHELQASITAHGFAWGESMRKQGTAKLREVSPQLSEVSFKKIHEEIQQKTPVLIYDGPFSDHIEQIKPRGVTGVAISDEEAARIAQDKVDLRPDVQYNYNQMGTGQGKIPIYRIQIVPSQGQSQEDIYVDISRVGGHVVSYLNSRPLGAATLDGNQAKQKAIDYLKAKGFPQMITTYTQVNDGSATIVFAGTKNGVIIYPDQIKVKVALDNGQIIGLDAEKYLMHNHERELETPKISANDARNLVDDKMKVERVQQAVIPLEAGREVQCWEVKGSWEGEEFYFYYNVLNGNEEKILKVIESSQGNYTM